MIIVTYRFYHKDSGGDVVGHVNVDADRMDVEANSGGAILKLYKHGSGERALVASFYEWAYAIKVEDGEIPRRIEEEPSTEDMEPWKKFAQGRHAAPDAA